MTVLVTRDGYTLTYRTHDEPNGMPAGGYTLMGCADDIIEPGDLVDVTITEPDDAVMKTEMGGGAGRGWGCTDAGP
ncbi:MAG TPA: hypothetical protein VM618_13655 [Acidimicrobiia bacterium]|nr:hypothetical protein [Acidimicrobiia bacterium]